MKKIIATIGAWVDKIDSRWQALSLKKQHRYVLYFFGAYLVLTIAVLLKVGCDTAGSRNNMSIEHIKNPVVPNKKPDAPVRDSISKILKKKMYDK